MLQIVTIDAGLIELFLHSRDLSYTLPSLTATSLRCFSFSFVSCCTIAIFQTLLTTMNVSA